MEATDFHSNKYLQNANYDPLINIFRQLREIGAQQGDYIKIYEDQSIFQPIYKISYLQQSKARPLQPINIRKSQSKQQSNNKNSAFYEIQEDSEKFRLSFGSQIYLKFTNLLQSKISLLKPFFNNLFVLLQIEGKGYINSLDEKIMVSQGEKTESIWMCIKCSSEDSDLLNRKEVYFCNFSQNQYLCIDTNGILAVCGQQKATRFILKRNPQGNSFILQGRNPLSMLVRNKSHQQVRKIIDKSLQRSDSSKTDIQIQLKITSVEDTMIAIHLQLNFSRKALEHQPSLKLIKLILTELCYYNVLDFLKNDSILSEHIQQLLLDYGILKLIANFLQKYLEEKRGDEDQNILIINKRASMAKRQSTFSKASQTSIQMLLTDVFKIVGLLCRQNIEISKVFFKLVDQLIVSQNYLLATYLIQENQYYLSQFHKANWYSLLYRAIFRNNKSQICHLVNFLTNFCQSQRDLRMLQSSITYWNKPSTNNQYLLYHSFKTGDFFTKIFQYELYVEGSYVFVHDSKSGKDVQFHTFIEGTLSESSQHIHHKSIKLENQQSLLEHTQGVQLILAQLKLLKAFQYNYNTNLISNSWGLAYGLIPYCYKQNFPQIKNYQIRTAILRMFIEIQPCYKYAKLSHPNLIVCSLVEGQSDNRKSLDEQPKLGYSNFVKSNKKKAQLSRKLLKQMGTHFLKKIKQWATGLRKKLININQLCFDEQNNLEQWLEIMIQAVTIRLFKVKQKKEGQLLGYIKKLFETIEQKKGVTQNEGNLMSDLTEFLIQILKIHPKYDRYLQQIKAKRLYDGKKNQINKVINTFQNKKEVKFIRVQKGLTKIQLIDVVHKNIQQQPKIRESSLKQTSSRPNQCEQKIPQLKFLALRLLQLMILNVNEQMIEEAVDTLAYLTKNPNAIQNLSSFNLMDLMPKYPFEQIIKRVTLQQWYLTSNTLLLDNYIDLLRLILSKKTSFRRSLCTTLLIDSQTVFKVFHNISYPLRFLKRAVHRVQTWLRPSLIEKYPDIYQGVDKNLQVVLDYLAKLKDTMTEEIFSKFIENLGLLNIFATLLQYMQNYYLQYETLPQLNRSRMYQAKNEAAFVEAKLTPLTSKIIKILQLYCLSNQSDQKSIQIKWTLSIFSQLLISTKLYESFVSKLAKNSLSYTNQSFLSILKSIPPTILAQTFKNFNKSWYLFKGFLYLQTQQFLRQIHILYQYAIQTMTQTDQIEFQRNFLSSNVDKNHHFSQKDKLQEEIYEFQHQTIFLKIILKLIYDDLWVQLIQWFKEKIFQQLIQEISKTSTQNYYIIQLTSEEIFRRRLIAQIAYYLKEKEQNKKPNYHLNIKQKEQQQSQTLQIKHTIIDFMIQQHKLSRFYINLDETDNSKYRKLSQSTLIQYLQYLVCDIAVLAFSLDFLSVGEISEDIHEYFDKLKDIYKRRVSQKSYEDTYAAFLNVQKMFAGEISSRHNYKPRTIKFDKFVTSSTRQTQPSLPENKAIRKWIKALKQIEKQTFIKNSELISQILQFDNIYELKNENQEINLVINHKDLFSKLIEISLNMKRLQINPQNQIFILQSLLIQVKPKKKNNKQINDQTSNYGFRLLQHLVQIQKILQIENIQQQLLKPWKTDVYCLALMLRIIDYSGCLKNHQARYEYLKILTKLFEKSLINYQSDLNQLILYFSTLHSKEQISTFQIILPFQSILSILVNHYTLKNLEKQYLKPIVLQLIKASIMINPQQKDDIVQNDIDYIKKILAQFDKDLINQVRRDLDQNRASYSYLLVNN